MKSIAVKPQYKLGDLVDGLEATIQGNPETIITGVSPIQQSQPGHITFLSNANYRKFLSTTQASAVILSSEHAADCPVNVVMSSNPYYIYAKIAAFFAEQQTTHPGIHSTAFIDESAIIHPTASIGPHCTIGKHVKIGPQATLQAGVVIHDDVEVGEYTKIDSHVTLHHKVKIGAYCHLSAGCVIGSEGFGFANQKGIWHKVPQLGSVEIGNHVDIGANTTIDRGAVENTIIENGAKLDNLIQVGHNVRIGENTIIAGCVAIAGSTQIGKNCMVGGATCFAGHLSICDNTMITGMTAVTKSILEPGIYSSGIVGAVPNHEFRKNNARFHRLENLIQRVKKLESELKTIKKEEQ